MDQGEIKEAQVQAVKIDLYMLLFFRTTQWYLNAHMTYLVLGV